MPNEKRQVNVRLSREGGRRFDRLLKEMPAVIGVRLSQAQLIELGLAALEKTTFPKQAVAGAS